MFMQRIFELGRIKYIFHNNYQIYYKPLLEHHIKSGFVDAERPNMILYWDDAERMTNYLDYVVRRINKYGLHWGILNQHKFDGYKELIKKEEDELVDYFLYEMRKAPVEEEPKQKMPL